MKDTNIGYWEKVLENPTPAYKQLIDIERSYLLEKIALNAYVLDIGCGDGRNMQTVLEKTEHVFGVDNDDIAITDAEERFKNVPTASVKKGEATSLPFGDKTFDIVIFFDILQNLDSQKEKALLEARRVLKDEGTIILCTYSEKALDERIKMYKTIGVPIEKIEGTKVFFEKSVGSYTSEQFSLDEIKDLTTKTQLKVNDLRTIGDLAYICELNKIVS